MFPSRHLGPHQLKMRAHFQKKQSKTMNVVRKCLMFFGHKFVDVSMLHWSTEMLKVCEQNIECTVHAAAHLYLMYACKQTNQRKIRGYSAYEFRSA